MKVRTTTSIELLEEAARVRAAKAAEFRAKLTELDTDTDTTAREARDLQRRADDARRKYDDLQRQADEKHAVVEDLQQQTKRLEPIAEQVQDEADDLYDQAAEARKDSGLPPRDELVANGQRDTQLQPAVPSAEETRPDAPAAEHRRVAEEGLDNGGYLITCSCTAVYAVPAAEDETAAIEAEHARHVAAAESTTEEAKTDV